MIYLPLRLKILKLKNFEAIKRIILTMNYILEKNWINWNFKIFQIKKKK